MNRRSGSNLVTFLLADLLIVAAWAAYRGDGAAHAAISNAFAAATPSSAFAATVSPSGGGGLQRAPATPGAGPTDRAGADDRNARIRDLDTQIKTLRDQFHQQLDPLEAQIKALREKFDPQIQTLVDQRKELVESGKAPDVRALDEQETSELASLADREKADIEKVRADYAAQRKALQQKYDDQRKALRGGK